MAAPGIAAVLVALGQAPTGEIPGRIVEQAIAAVEADSAARAAAVWRARLARNPVDRGARLGLATLAQLTYNYQQSDSLYTLLLPGDRPPVDRFGIAARLGLAATAQLRGLTARAAEELARAATEGLALGDSAGRAQALIGLAWIGSRSGGPRRVDSLFAVAAATLPAGDLRLRAHWGCARAAVLAARRDSTAAAGARAGLALAHRAGDQRREAICLHAVAQDEIWRGRMEAGLAALETAAAIQRRVRDRASLAATLQWLGFLLQQHGDYGPARQRSAEALVEGVASGYRSPVAWALLTLASLSNLVGDQVSAEDYLGRARALFEAQADRWGLAGALQLEATISVGLGDLTRAERAVARSLAWAAEAGNVPIQFWAHEVLADVARARRDWTAAEGELVAARAIARERGMAGLATNLLHDFGEVALRRGDVSRAERDLRAYLATSEQEGYYEYSARALLAEVYARTGRVAEAEGELSRAAATMNRWRASVGDRQLRVHLFQTGVADVDPGLGVATVISAIAAAGRVSAAFRLAEEQRARELLDDLVRARVSYPDSRGAVDSARTSGEPVSLEAVAEALPDERTGLVEYVTGVAGEPTTAFVVTRRGAAAYRLPPVDSLNADIAWMVAALESGDYPVALARRLGAALLDAALSHLPASVSRLVVVPDAGLYRVPFDALLDNDGRPMVRRFAVSLAPSASVAAWLWRRPRNRGDGALLAFGDPAFPGDVEVSGSEEARVYHSAFLARGGLPRLAASAREARGAARYAPRGEVRLRRSASEAFLKRADLQPYRILHFATHALVDERATTRTSLALAPGDGEDGFVGPADLAALKLDADIVVLSACRTAGGVVVTGEGVQGLTAPLLQAGARAVLATAWLIRDRSAAELIDAFYHGLAQGRAAGDALHAAKLAALSRGAPASEWAAFTLVGDPLVRVPLRARGGGRPLVWWVAVPIGLILGYGLVRLMIEKRRKAERA